MINYKAHPTLAGFHHSNKLFRGVRGPRNSGKSTGMTLEILRRAAQQKPAKDGYRYTRWAIVRQTYPELRDTTLKTWLSWALQDRMGNFNYGTMTHRVEFNDIRAEVLFRALDRPADVKKLLSLEVTGAWFNEAREIPFSIIQAMRDAIGRYPALVDGGPSWYGIMLDTNPPDEDHWWYRFAEEETPAGWQFWAQPPALIKKDGIWVGNPKAENLENIIGGINWYLERVPGADEDHIACYYGNQYVFVKEGKPVHSAYSDHFHCSKEPLKPSPHHTIVIGIDFGLTPAAIFGQRIAGGRWIIFDELVTEDMGAKRFAEVLGPMLRGKYRNFDFEIYGDPAGDDRAQTDESTPFEILNAANIQAEPAPSNDLVLRIEAVDSVLNRVVEGQPAFLVSPKCKVLRKGLAGGYYYKRLQVSGEERYRNKPNKNRFSHPCEALQYLLLGAGEGDALIANARIGKGDQYDRTDHNVNKEHAWMLG